MHHWAQQKNCGWGRLRQYLTGVKNHDTPAKPLKTRGGMRDVPGECRY
jgi:hypothetical protein